MREIIGLEICKVSMALMPLKEKLQKIAELVAEALDIKRCIIAKIYDNQYEYVAGIVREKYGPPHTLGAKYPLEECPPIAQIVADENHSPMLIADPEGDKCTAYMHDLVRNADIAAILFVPVITKENVDFIIILDAVHEQRFNDTDVKFVKKIAEIIHETKKLEKRIKHRQGLESLVAISAAIAHETRNPLTQAGGYINLLAKQTKKKCGKNKKLLEITDVIMGEFNRLQDTLDNWLGLFSLSDLKLEMRPLYIKDEIIKPILEKGNIKKLKKNIKITLWGKGGKILVDEAKIGKAFTELLANALGHVQKLKIPKEDKVIKITVRKIKNMTRVVISNPAVIKGDPNDMFRPFITNNVNRKGTGLTLAQHYIEMHDEATVLAKKNGDNLDLIIHFPIIEG